MLGIRARTSACQTALRSMRLLLPSNHRTPAGKAGWAAGRSEAEDPERSVRVAARRGGPSGSDAHPAPPAGGNAAAQKRGVRQAELAARPRVMRS
jgi:hypothetical protein